jgi:hypothetical protein
MAGSCIKPTIASKPLEWFKLRIRDTTRRAKGISIKTTMEELAKYAGLTSRLFPLLRNTRGVDRSHSLGPVTTAGPPLWRQWKTSGGRERHSSHWESRETCATRPVAAVDPGISPGASPLGGTLQCLQIARSAVPDRSTLAQLLEPWHGRGGAASLPYPDHWHIASVPMRRFCAALAG